MRSVILNVTMQERVRCEQAVDDLRQEVDRKRHRLTELRISVSDCPTVSRPSVNHRSPSTRKAVGTYLFQAHSMSKFAYLYAVDYQFPVKCLQISLSIHNLTLPG